MSRDREEVAAMLATLTPAQKQRLIDAIGFDDPPLPPHPPGRPAPTDPVTEARRGLWAQRCPQCPGVDQEVRSEETYDPDDAGHWVTRWYDACGHAAIVDLETGEVDVFDGFGDDEDG